MYISVMELEPGLLSWLQPRKNNCVPTELDVSILAYDKKTRYNVPPLIPQGVIHKRLEEKSGQLASKDDLPVHLS